MTSNTESDTGDRQREDSWPPSPSATPPSFPPPPSAPAEFLDGQSANGEAVTSQPPDLVPPPPTAPQEFLDAQWTVGDNGEVSPSGIGIAEIDAVLDPGVLSAEQLEQLAAPQLTHVAATPDQDSEPPAQAAALSRIRAVPLMDGESVEKVFVPENGLSDAVPVSGQALVLTNRRLIAFRGVEGFRDTHIADPTAISQCSVRTGQRNWAAVLQGLAVITGGAFLYLIAGYWLAGRFSGPNIPVLNMDLAPFLALLIIVVGMLMLLQNYFIRPAGALVFHGPGIDVAFPLHSSLDMDQVYDFVEAVQQLRRDVTTAKAISNTTAPVEPREADSRTEGS